MWMLFFSLLCVTASAFQHSHLAKDVEVFGGRDACFTIVYILLCRPCFLVSLVPLARIQQFCPPFGLHANIVEEYVLLSALLHDQSCLQSSPCFQHQFVWLPFLEPLFARVGVLFMYMGARESCLRTCATLLCHARVKTIGTSLCLTSSSLIVSATITERS